MDRRREKRQRRAHRQTNRRPAPHHRPPATQDDALRGLTVGLDEPHPLRFLAHVSSLWAALSRPAEHRSAPDASEFVQSMIEVPAPQTTAILTVLSAYATDELLERRISRELANRTHGVPSWLATLDQVEVVRLARQTEPLGDGDQYWFEVAWPDGTALSYAVLVDANWGYALKDILVVPDRIAAPEAIIAQHSTPEEEITFAPITPADARAQVTEAIAHSDMFFPPVETDDWPQGRAMLAWILRMLPEGGAGFPEVDLGEPARERVVADFLASPYGQGLGPEAASMVDSLVWFAGFNCGDPLRWSTVKLEMLLLDWWHRKIVQAPEADRALPRILRAFVRWSGEQRGLAPHFVDQNVAAIDTFEPELLTDIGTPRRNTAADLARMAGGLPLDEEEPEDDADGFLAVLAHWVGGWDALDALTADPLPDEAFDPSGIARDILPAALSALESVEAEVVARDLPAASELVTVARRMVRRAALADPAAWRRRAKPAGTAFAFTYLLYDVNRLLRGHFYVKDLVADFGLSSAPQTRIDTFRRALGLPFRGGDSALMTSVARQEVLDIRDRLSDLELWAT